MRRYVVPVIAFLAVAGFLAAIPGQRLVRAQGSPPPGAIELALQSGSEFDARDLAGLRKFYAARAFAPAWSGAQGLTRDGQAALAVLAKSDGEGLDPKRYDVARLKAPWPDGAARDMTLTAALLRYAADLADGRPDFRAIDSDIELPPSGIDTAAGLAQALSAHKLPEYFQSLLPRLPEYAALRGALAQYRAIAAKGGWSPIAAAKSFRADSADPDMLENLRARLAFEDAALARLATPSAADIDAAVRRFQARNGVEDDSLIGAKTVALLNVTAASRALQIAANMERMRWLPQNFEAARIVVNVPDARLAVIENGREVLSSAVIVGRPKDRTPIFRAEVTGVVANPPWIVPAKIARQEIMPKANSNPDYLARNHLVVDNGQVRQLPGPDNSLGQIKLELDDHFAVYLHDTPAKALFARRQRFLSHGCIRVAQIIPLASYALSGDTTTGIESLMAAIATTDTVHLAVKARIPVYVVYFTAFSAPDGLQFRADVYGRDKRMIAAMAAQGFAQLTVPTANCDRKA